MSRNDQLNQSLLVRQEEVVVDENAAALAVMTVTTEMLLVDQGVAQRLGIVSADVAFGAGPLKDMAIGLTNALERDKAVKKPGADRKAAEARFRRNLVGLQGRKWHLEGLKAQAEWEARVCPAAS